MHPPDFNPNHRLSDWPECFIEAGCPTCGKVTIAAVKMLLAGGRDAPLLETVKRFKCSACKVTAAPVYLVAGRTRRFVGGPRPDLAVELVPAPKATVASDKMAKRKRSLSSAFPPSPAVAWSGPFGSRASPLSRSP
jgi:hypothetical protein